MFFPYIPKLSNALNTIVNRENQVTLNSGSLILAWYDVILTFELNLRADSFATYIILNITFRPTVKKQKKKRERERDRVFLYL